MIPVTAAQQAEYQGAVRGGQDQVGVADAPAENGHGRGRPMKKLSELNAMELVGQREMT